eukprot:9342280-Pyramimonas_sp.AAC.1
MLLAPEVLLMLQRCSGTRHGAVLAVGMSSSSSLLHPLPLLSPRPPRFHDLSLLAAPAATARQSNTPRNMLATAMPNWQVHAEDLQRL